jgi:GntR family transcriptional regulator / MocR family aminotransferase
VPAAFFITVGRREDAMSRVKEVQQAFPVEKLDPIAGDLKVQLVNVLRESITKDSSTSRVRLPSTRALAARLNIGRGTVVRAYEQLRFEGYIETATGSGTMVVEGIESVKDVQFADRKLHSGGPKIPESGDAFVELAKGLALRSRSPRDGVGYQVSNPSLILSRLFRSADKTLDGSPPDLKGLKALRETIARSLCKTRHVRCTADNIVITGSYQQGLHLVARLLLKGGDEIWVDEAVEEGVSALLKSVNLRPRLVADISAEATSVLGKPAVARAVVSAEATLMRLPITRRASLLEWARNVDAWILERIDDVGYSFDGRAMPCLQSLDPERVLITGRFDSAISSCVQLGYMVVPEHLAEALAGARYLVDGDLPTIPQRVLASYISRGHLSSFKKLAVGSCKLSKSSQIPVKEML